MIQVLRRLALPIAITSLVVNLVMTAVSLGLWWLAIANGWVESVTFVSHVSMLALVYGGVSGLAAAVAGILALFPPGEILGKKSPE